MSYIILFKDGSYVEAEDRELFEYTSDESFLVVLSDATTAGVISAYIQELLTPIFETVFEE